MLAACRSLPTSRPKVLVVEDDLDLRTLISAILTASGYRVRSSHDGCSALEKIRTELPDIVLSDLFMAGMSGFELLSVIRRKISGYQGRRHERDPTQGETCLPELLRTPSMKKRPTSDLCWL